ncbi:unnamed protein product, partial [Amoebophrya sp. A120]
PTASPRKQRKKLVDRRTQAAYLLSRRSNEAKVARERASVELDSSSDDPDRFVGFRFDENKAKETTTDKLNHYSHEA